ncbi:MAG TPA: phosphotransferase [Xanthomonadales bacterium]|nr:phosphotransferase [Xanthomonadales bacterium]
MNEITSPEGAGAPSSAESTPLLPCHIIIAHPDKPKFLVIRHSGDHWSPPMLKVPVAGSIMYKPAMINRGMMKKYGLRTTVLRIVMEAQNYVLIELELHASSKRQMQAVWVGREEYAQFKKRGDDDTDPFEFWLQEKEDGEVSDLRAPWQRYGWYQRADEWLTQKLVELGIQERGSIQQFKAGWPMACILRVSTSQGQVYLKSSYNKKPGEARLTNLLAGKWPEHVPAPLASDEASNWMVLRDFKLRNENIPSWNDLPEFARVLGKIQVGLMDELENLKEIECGNMNLDFLCNTDGRSQDLFESSVALLQEGQNALTDDDLDLFRSSVLEIHESCRELECFEIPDSLSHLDFRPDNLFVEDGRYFVIDWADVAITHPFMALCRTLDFFEHYMNEDMALDGHDHIDQEVVNSMKDAYLANFVGFQPHEKLEEAFRIAYSIYPLFYFYYVAGQIRLIEPGSPHSDLLVHLLKSRARILIRSGTE